MNKNLMQMAKLLLVAAAMSMHAPAKAQEAMVVEKKDGSTTSFAIGDVNCVYFEGNTGNDNAETGGDVDSKYLCVPASVKDGVRISRVGDCSMTYNAKGQLVSSTDQGITYTIGEGLKRVDFSGSANSMEISGTVANIARNSDGYITSCDIAMNVVSLMGVAAKSDLKMAMEYNADGMVSHVSLTGKSTATVWGMTATSTNKAEAEMTYSNGIIQKIVNRQTDEMASPFGYETETAESVATFSGPTVANAYNLYDAYMSETLFDDIVESDESEDEDIALLNCLFYAGYMGKWSDALPTHVSGTATETSSDGTYTSPFSTTLSYTLNADGTLADACGLAYTYTSTPRKTSARAAEGGKGVRVKISGMKLMLGGK